MLMVMGPHAGLGNFPRAEYSVEWVTDLVRHARDHGLTRIEATDAGTAAWTDHVKHWVRAAGQRGRLVDDASTAMSRANRPAGSCATAAATLSIASSAMRSRRTSIASWRWTSSRQPIGQAFPSASRGGSVRRSAAVDRHPVADAVLLASRRNHHAVNCVSTSACPAGCRIC